MKSFRRWRRFIFYSIIAISFIGILKSTTPPTSVVSGNLSREVFASDSPAKHRGIMPIVSSGELAHQTRGFTAPKIEHHGVQKHESGRAFRTKCAFSHYNFDDPIVFPGVSNATHLHAYYGRTKVNAFTNPLNLRSTDAASTCSGGTANLSSYWFPAMLDKDKRPVRPNSPQDELKIPKDDKYVFNNSLIYYKSHAADDVKVVVPPLGFRMITGNALNSSPEGAIGKWSCHKGSNDSRPYQVNQYSHLEDFVGATILVGNKGAIPVCLRGQTLKVEVSFPSCWDGVNLDSPNHQSHMAQTLPFGRCPATHPVRIPDISYVIFYNVWNHDSTEGWRVASDSYASSKPGGYSMHADWINGWNPSIFSTFVGKCLNGNTDCGTDDLNDGRHLTGLDYFELKDFPI